MSTAHLPVSILNNEINTRNDLISFAQLYSKDLKLHQAIDPYLFLLALMSIETSFGFNNVPRFEYSYSRNSLAYKRSRYLQEGYELWGDCCAMSFGPCQILWIVAKELGFPGHPFELWHAAVSLPYVVKLLNRLSDGGADTVQRMSAAYNAGLGAIKMGGKFPELYVKKFVSAYEDCKTKYK